jgi:hypothetical protein
MSRFTDNNGNSIDTAASSNQPPINAALQPGIDPTNGAGIVNGTKTIAPTYILVAGQPIAAMSNPA